MLLLELNRQRESRKIFVVIRQVAFNHFKVICPLVAKKRTKALNIINSWATFSLLLQCIHN